MSWLIDRCESLGYDCALGCDLESRPKRKGSDLRSRDFPSGPDYKSSPSERIEVVNDTGDDDSRIWSDPFAPDV